MRPLLFTLLLCAAGAAAAQTADKALADKADRAFVNSEWAGASALYMLLSDKIPDAALPYARIIVAQEMCADTAGSIATMERALANTVPVDSVLEPAREAAFSLSRPDLYENLLLRLQRSLPYLHRVIDIRLLRYYTLRRDPEKMADYSRRMLAGNPADTDAIATIADAAVMEGDTDAAIAAWERILAIDPANYNALAALANTLATADPVRAAAYAERALAIRPNNALSALLRSLK